MCLLRSAGFDRAFPIVMAGPELPIVKAGRAFPIVMAGLDPAISRSRCAGDEEMPGSRPGMTIGGVPHDN